MCFLGSSPQLPFGEQTGVEEARWRRDQLGWGLIIQKTEAAFHGHDRGERWMETEDWGFLVGSTQMCEGEERASGGSWVPARVTGGGL